MNAIFVPSGDQFGLASRESLNVSRVCPVPSAFITKISLLVGSPGTKECEKAILVPSGDQAGNTSSPRSLVSWTGFVPSSFITQMSRWPARALGQAILPLAPGVPWTGSPALTKISTLAAKAAAASIISVLNRLAFAIVILFPFFGG